MTVAPCADCQHGAGEHRLESVGVLGPTTTDVETAEKIRGDVPRVLIGPFRCVVDGCACPNYVDEPLSARKAKPTS